MKCDKCDKVIGTEPEDNPAYEVNILLHKGPGDDTEDYFRGDTVGVYCHDCMMKGLWS
ncbi:MAG: hypothetical protein ABIH46_13880 [Chloroflexota bacterium]